MRVRCSSYQGKRWVVEVIVPVVRLGEGREDVVAETEVQGQLAVDTPIILRIVTFFPCSVSGIDQQMATFIAEWEAGQHVFRRISRQARKQDKAQGKGGLGVIKLSAGNLRTTFEVVRPMRIDQGPVVDEGIVGVDDGREERVTQIRISAREEVGWRQS